MDYLFYITLAAIVVFTVMTLNGIAHGAEPCHVSDDSNEEDTGASANEAQTTEATTTTFVPTSEKIEAYNWNASTSNRGLSESSELHARASWMHVYADELGKDPYMECVD